MNRLLAHRIRCLKQVPGVKVRYSEEEDSKVWGEWLTEPDVVRFYPMEGESERIESVERMASYCKYHAALTAEYEGKVAGIAYINLHPYRKIAHQALFTIIVGKEFRGKGIGQMLLEHLERTAKENFGLESLHLEVYEGNPAIRLYRRMGYREFGFQSHWIKELSGDYRGKIYMEKWL